VIAQESDLDRQNRMGGRNGTDRLTLHRQEG
jgi:hypothetical protein